MTLDDLLSEDLPVDVLRRGVEVLLEEARREGETAGVESMLDFAVVDYESGYARGRADQLRAIREEDERVRREVGWTPSVVVDPKAARELLRAVLGLDSEAGGEV